MRKVNITLIVLGVAVFMVVVSFPFCQEDCLLGMVNPEHFDYHFHYWQFSAGLFTVVTTAVFYVDAYSARFGRAPVLDGIQTGSQGVIIACVIISVVALLGFAVNFFTAKKIGWELRFLTVLFVCWVIIDLVIWKTHSRKGVRTRFRDSFFRVDFPFLVSFLILLIVWERSLSVRPEALDVKAFFGGAIAFKLLIQNCAFLLGEIQDLLVAESGRVVDR